MRGKNSSPHPTEDLAAPLIQANPSHSTPNKSELYAEYPPWSYPPPSTTNSQYAEESLCSSLQSPHPKLPDLGPPRSKPLFRGFEKPSFSRIAILAVLCLISYPAFYILTFVAKDRSLFIVRLVVSTWCSGVGFALGYVLLRIGAQHLEAASEFWPVGFKDILSSTLCKQHGPPWSI